MDEWHYNSEFHQLPRNLTAKEFRALPGDFKVPRLLCPGSLVGPDESAIGDGAVYSMLCSCGDQWWSRHVTGVSFPLYLWWFRDVDALSIEGTWLKLPLIRQGKPARGTNAGRQNKGRMTLATAKGGNVAWSGSSKVSG